MKIKKLILVGIVALTMTACSNDEPQSLIKDTPVRIQTNISPLMTRAGVNAEELQDENFRISTDILVYLTKTSSKWEDIDNYTSNVLNTPNASTATGFPFLNAGLAWIIDDSRGVTVKYPETGNVDAVGFHPWTFDITSGEFSVQTDQSTYDGYRKSDLMVASTMNHSPSSGDIPLNFEHKLAKVIIKLVKGQNISDEQLASATISLGCDNYPINATISYTGLDKTKPDEDFSISITPAYSLGSIELGTYNPDGNAAIVIPTTYVSQGDFLEIKIGTSTYWCAVPNDQPIQLSPGTVTTINVEVSNDYVNFTSVDIKPWNNGGTYNEKAYR